MNLGFTLHLVTELHCDPHNSNSSGLYAAIHRSYQVVLGVGDSDLVGHVVASYIDQSDDLALILPSTTPYLEGSGRHSRCPPW
jgi:hypothetical protein